MLLALLLTRKLVLYEHILALDLGLRRSKVVLVLRLTLARWLDLLLTVLNLMLLAIVLLLHMPHLLGYGLIRSPISDQLLTI